MTLTFLWLVKSKTISRLPSSASNSPATGGHDDHGASKSLATGGYAHAGWPENLAKHVLLGPERWFGSEGCPDSPQQALKSHGFLVLKSFLPKELTSYTCHHIREYFLSLLKSFTGGYAIDEGPGGFKKMIQLPTKVWQRKDIGKGSMEVVLKQFPRGTQLGMQLNESGQVLGNSGASKKCFDMLVI